jgi:hypothetical protein
VKSPQGLFLSSFHGLEPIFGNRHNAGTVRNLKGNRNNADFLGKFAKQDPETGWQTPRRINP